MQANIFSILAAILHLGNIKFAKERDETKIVNIDGVYYPFDSAMIGFNLASRVAICGVYAETAT